MVVTYGAMAETALGAAARLMVEEEIMADVLVLTQISPLPWEEMEPFLRQSPRVVTLEEGTVRGGWGSEVTACCCQDFPGKEYLRIGARNCPLPTNVELERLILPSEESVYTRIKEWMAE